MSTMSITALKRRLFTPYLSFRYDALPELFPGQHLAMYTIPFQTQYALAAWIIPNGRGGWKLAPDGDPGPLPEATVLKRTWRFGPFGLLHIASAEFLGEAGKPGTRFAAYPIPFLKRVAVCWLERDDLDATAPAATDDSEPAT